MFVFSEHNTVSTGRYSRCFAYTDINRLWIMLLNGGGLVRVEIPLITLI